MLTFAMPTTPGLVLELRAGRPDVVQEDGPDRGRRSNPRPRLDSDRSMHAWY